MDVFDPAFFLLQIWYLRVCEDCTITMADADLVAMAQGKLDGMQAFMGGKLKIKGNMMLAQKLARPVLPFSLFVDARFPLFDSRFPCFLIQGSLFG